MSILTKWHRSGIRSCFGGFVAYAP